MFELGIFSVLRPPRSLSVRFRRLGGLILALLLFAPAAALAQSADLLRAYQNFETAKAANRVADALTAATMPCG